MSESVTWLSHEFTVYDPKTTDWNEIAGIYIFAGLNAQELWVPLYIGQTDDFHARLPSHERWTEAELLGATHVHAMVVSLAASRDTIEKELIQAYQPPLNVQLK